MKAFLKYLSIALIAITAFSCIKEDGEIVPKGQVKVMVKVAEEISDPADYTIKAKFFREYSGQLVDVTLKVESITESGELVSAAEIIEYGNWQLQQVTLLYDGDATYVGVDEDDERSSQIGEESFLPLKTNVLEGETSTFSLELVEFNPEVDIDGTTALYYDFSDGKKYDKVELNGWSTVDAIEGADRGWAYGEANGEKFAEASVETGEESSYTSYMVSPALDLDGATNKRVWFKTAQTLWTNGTDFQVYLMDGPNPITAKKVELTDANLAGKSSVDAEWVESGEVDLSSYTGIQYVAFYYKANGGKDNSTTFRVTDFVYGDEDIPGTPVVTEPTYIYDFNDGTKDDPINKSDWLVINKGSDSDKQWVYGEYNEDLYANISAYGAAGTDYESWMISAEMDLDKANGSFVKFDTKLGYTNGAIFTVYVMDTNDPSTASVMDELTFTRPEDNSSGYSDFVSSGDIDLSAYSGKIYFGFKYLATTGQTSTFQVDNFVFGYDTDGSGGDGGSGEEGSNSNPYTVEKARTIQDESNAWVKGYVIGWIDYNNGDPLVKTEIEGAANTNLALADNASETDVSKMIFVQLSGDDTGPVRSQLGIGFTNGASLGYELKLNGSLENYFGSNPGLKGIKTEDHFEILSE